MESPSHSWLLFVPWMRYSLRLLHDRGSRNPHQFVNMSYPIPCVATLIRRGNKILLHKRKGKHAPGHWACPGGHIEKWETFEEAARRKTKEEAGDDLRFANIRLWRVVNFFFKDEDRHYIVIYLLAEWISGEAVVMEPNKCERWEWFDWGSMPSPLVQDLEEMLKLS